MRSRPRRTSRTKPALASTLRCLVTAWRVRAEPAVSRVVERGPWDDSRPTSASRVSSPSAANIGAGRREILPRRMLRGDMSLDVLDLRRPAVLVYPERFGAPRQRDAIEARLNDRELGAAGHLLEAEFDEGGWLFRVIDVGLDGIRMPAIRHQALGIHSLDEELDGEVLIAGRCDLAFDPRAWFEGTMELTAKPRAELLGVGQRAPNA